MESCVVVLEFTPTKDYSPKRTLIPNSPTTVYNLSIYKTVIKTRTNEWLSLINDLI